MKPEDAITQVMAIITPLAARGADVAQEVAGRVLGDAAARRLHLAGDREAAGDFPGNAHGDSPLPLLPRQAAQRHAGAGHHSDTISGARVATRGGSYHQGDNITTNIIKSGAGRIGVLTAVAIIVCGGLLVRGGDALPGTRGGGLTAGSTCQQFLAASAGAQQQALAGLAMPGLPGGRGGPPALRRVRCACGFAPAATLGAVLERARGGY